jgi:adenosylcobyric acid synthase
LAWLRRTGLADAVLAHHAAGRPVLGLCGGFQMLAAGLTDRVESGAGVVAGLGLLDVDIEFVAEKTLGNPVGTAFGSPAVGYEIHHGQVVRRGAGVAGLVTTAAGEPEGALCGAVAATHWHGLLENDEVRRSVLRWAAELAGRSGFVPAPDVSFAEARAAQLDLLGELVAEHLDTAAVLDLIANGAPAGLPVIPPAGPSHPPA